MDTLTAPARSALMARVRSMDTGPERRVRSALHALGLRFRLHRRDLPGTPDIVLPKHRMVVFAQGCFWHQHCGCTRATLPKSRADFWAAKLKANVARDGIVRRRLHEMGWRHFDIWECETKNPDVLGKRIKDLQATLRAHV